MDGDALYQRLAAMRDELDEILRTIEFPAEDAGDDFTPPGEFELADDAVFIAPVPNIPVPVDCGDAATHGPHLWTGYEPDGTTPVTYQCKGVPF